MSGDQNDFSSNLQERLLPDHGAGASREVSVPRIEHFAHISPISVPANQHQNVIFDQELNNETSTESQDEGESWSRGEKQPSKFRDAGFAVLFMVQLIVVLFFAFAWGVPAVREANNNGGDMSYKSPEEKGEMAFAGFLYLCLCSGAASLGISALALYVMTLPKVSAHVIQFSMFFSFCVSIICAVVFAQQGHLLVSLYFLLIFLLGVCYAFCVWHRIPFAAANLSTAITAIRANWGVFIVAMGMVLKVILWSFLWILAVFGVYFHTMNCNDDESECTSKMNQPVFLLFLLSFYWTSEVLKNIVHVTIAGVVGTWWFAPIEAASWCSTAITDSFARSLTYSFGSICLGSLLVAIIQVLRHIIHQLRVESRRNGNDATMGILLCILECIIKCLQDILEYFNKWAYIYVGLYGYDYKTAGKNVIKLFRDRGWTTIINDNLVQRSLFMLSMVIAGLSGCFGLLLGVVKPAWTESFGDANNSGSVLSFFIPYLIGLSMSLVLMSVISSAVDTVIVCFAESPQEFQINYPELSQVMIDAWTRIFPDEFSGFAQVQGTATGGGAITEQQENSRV